MRDKLRWIFNNLGFDHVDCAWARIVLWSCDPTHEEYLMCCSDHPMSRETPEKEYYESTKNQCIKDYAVKDVDMSVLDDNCFLQYYKGEELNKVNIQKLRAMLQSTDEEMHNVAMTIMGRDLQNNLFENENFRSFVVKNCLRTLDEAEKKWTKKELNK